MATPWEMEMSADLQMAGGCRPDSSGNGWFIGIAVTAGAFTTPIKLSMVIPTPTTER